MGRKKVARVYEDELKRVMQDSETRVIDISDLSYDLSNPRFYHIALVKTLTPEIIEEEIWNDSETRDLYNQILAVKGIYEPLLVEKIDKTFVVKEGNRRLACLRKLKKEAHAGKFESIKKETFDKVSCKILPQGVSQSTIALLLILEHIAGKQTWKPFNKAKFIKELNTRYRLIYENIAGILRMSRATIARAIEAYDATEKYAKKYSDDPLRWEKYTYFEELYKNKNLANWRKDENNISLFMDWVRAKRFKDVRDVRILDEIIKDKSLARTFDVRGGEAARKELDQKNPARTDRYFKKIYTAIETCRSLPPDERVEAAKNDAKIDMLKVLIKEAKALLDNLQNMRDIKK